MIEAAASACLFFLSAALLAALYRVVRGPSIADRVAATDLLTSCIMAIIVVFSILARTRDYFDVVLSMAILGFFGTVAFARYLIGGRALD